VEELLYSVSVGRVAGRSTAVGAKVGDWEGCGNPAHSTVTGHLDGRDCLVSADQAHGFATMDLCGIGGPGRRSGSSVMRPPL